MLLYESYKDKILVYVFCPKKFGGCVSDFKREQMKKIDPSRRVLKAVTNEKKFPLHRENLLSEIKYSDVDYENKKLFNKTFHKIQSYNNSLDYNYYSNLECYYIGSFVNSPVITVLVNGVYENWIITQGAYTQYYGNEYTLDGVINIPNSLKELKMIEQGNFSNLSDDIIKKYVDLFTFKKEPMSIYDKSFIRDLISDKIVDCKITDDILKRDSESVKRLRKIYK